MYSTTLNQKQLELLLLTTLGITKREQNKLLRSVFNALTSKYPEGLSKGSKTTFFAVPGCEKSAPKPIFKYHPSSKKWQIEIMST